MSSFSWLHLQIKLVSSWTVRRQYVLHVVSAISRFWLSNFGLIFPVTSCQVGLTVQSGLHGQVMEEGLLCFLWMDGLSPDQMKCCGLSVLSNCLLLSMCCPLILYVLLLSVWMYPCERSSRGTVLSPSFTLPCLSHPHLYTLMIAHTTLNNSVDDDYFGRIWVMCVWTVNTSGVCLLLASYLICIPADVTARPSCYWGKNCHTQRNKPSHARWVELTFMCSSRFSYASRYVCLCLCMKQL